MAFPYDGTGTSATQVIRGIDIQKLAEGFAEEGIILKNYVRVSSVNAREIRYYSKTAGFLTGATTTGITTTQVANTSMKSLAPVLEPEYTRATAFVRTYFATSPAITDEDIKDCDPSVWGDIIRDLVRAVNYQVDSRIYAVATTATGIQTSAATGREWDDPATADIIGDIELMKQALRAYSFDPQGAVLYINSIEYMNLIKFLINVKGSSIPQFSSDKVSSGQVLELLGVKIVVSENATTDQALMFIPQKSLVWAEFMPLTTAIVDDPLISKKFRVKCEGECYCPNPKSIYLLTDTHT